MANLSSSVDQDIADEEDVFLENGSLSYENPNYQLNFGHLGCSVRLEDALNSNTEHFNLNSSALLRRRIDMVDVDMLSPDMSNMDLGLELELAVRNGTSSASTLTGGNATRQRRHYASLDPTSMGVDVQIGPVMNMRSPDFDNNHQAVSACDKATTATNCTAPSVSSTTCAASAAAAGDTGDTTDPAATPAPENAPPADAASAGDPECLPPGWEKHEDDDGPYYWHIKSGTIQREPPPPPSSHSAGADANTKLQQQPALNFRRFDASATAPPVGGDVQPPFPTVAVVPRSATSFALADAESLRTREENAFKRRSYPAAPLDGTLTSSTTSSCSSSTASSSSATSTSRSGERAIRFAVRSLGWVEIAEDDLTPERSSKAVNRCIVDLSLGRNDLLDVVGRWGDGKDLFMDLDEGSLKLIDPENGAALNSQPIHTIRVWGVGRDNGRERDFAYVARDRVSRRHMCHVFRCDTPARTIANALRDICKKIMIERSLQHSTAVPGSAHHGLGGSSSTAGFGALRSADSSVATSIVGPRPNNLPTEQRRPLNKIGHILSSQSFPTPMEEPRKVLKAQYVGSCPVLRPSGMDVLNDAIEQMVHQIDREHWRNVNVSVAPSVITITDTDDEEKVIVESRVRFLSFLGIGRHVENCAFIVHTANDVFIAHVLHCYPSSGAICKTIEAACKLRYQKCLDAHGALRGGGVGSGGGSGSGSSSAAGGLQTPTGRSLEGIGAALKSVLGSITKSKSKTTTLSTSSSSSSMAQAAESC